MLRYTEPEFIAIEQASCRAGLALSGYAAEAALAAAIRANSPDTAARAYLDDHASIITRARAALTSNSRASARQGCEASQTTACRARLQTRSELQTGGLCG